MAAFGILEEGREYELTVREIYEAASNFVSKRPPNFGTTLFCHHYILEDDVKVRYKCQVCEPIPTQSHCNPGDVMGVKVKSFKMEIHTVEFTSRDGKSLVPVANLPGKEIGTFQSDPAAKETNYPYLPDTPSIERKGVVIEPFAGPTTLISPYNNGPVVAGTARAVALECANVFFANRMENEQTGETVLLLADKYFDYLTQKT